MRSFLLASAGLLFASSASGEPHVPSQAVIVGTGAAQFAVLRQDSLVIARFLGGAPAPRESWIVPAARQAIEEAVGCPVLRDSVEVSGKTVKGSVDCAGRTGFFVRTNTGARGRTSRSGLGSTRAQGTRNGSPDELEPGLDFIPIP